MPSNNSKKSDRKGKEKANASTSASTSISHVLTGRVLPSKIAPSLPLIANQDQRYMDIVDMFNKVNENIEGVKSDIANVNTNMTTFKNKLGVLVGTSEKTNMAFVEFAKAYANDQARMASEILKATVWKANFQSDDPVLVADNESK
ncbi:hypothetical protein F4703DRAFT_1921320 [Phycomyces blakesleeanus]